MNRVPTYDIFARKQIVLEPPGGVGERVRRQCASSQFVPVPQSATRGTLMR